MITSPLGLLLCIVLHAQAPLPSADGTRLGGFQAELADLQEPTAAAFAPDGSLYVVESFRDRVLVFDDERHVIREFGGHGTAFGKLCDPHGLAIASDGTVYVADTANHRISVFAGDGTFRFAFGARGRGLSEFDSPMGVAVDATRVCVADSRNHRVQVFDREGHYRGEFGSFGTEAGRFRFPVDVALASDGTLYVADQDNHRIQSFDAQARFTAQWGVFGPFPGQLASPTGVEVAGERVFVADRDNHRIEVFDRAGKLVYEWGIHALRPHEGAGKLHYPNQIAIDAGATRAVVVEGFENRCQIFGPITAAEATATQSQERNTAAHYGGAVDARGVLVVAVEPSTPGFVVLDTTLGEAVDITRVGGFGPRIGQFTRPEGIALDPLARIAYVADAGAHRLATYLVDRPAGEALKYDPGLARLSESFDCERRFALETRPEGLAPMEPVAVECGGADAVFVLDAANQEIAEFTPTLQFVKRFGKAGHGAGELVDAADLAFDPDTRRLFVVDRAAARVQVFERDGRPAFAFGRHGDAPGELTRPAGIACGPDGTVFVSDEATHRISRFDSNGNFVSAFGREGLGRVEFYKPRGLAIDPANRLVVLDHGNHRGQVLTLDGEFVTSFGARIFIQPTLAPPRVNASEPAKPAPVKRD